MKFKGWDWTELTKAFRIKVKGKDDDQLLQETKDYLHNCLYNGSKKEKKCADTVREFLKALYKDSRKWDYRYPLWKGLGEIKHDETLIIYTVRLLEDMWV
ncbi:hypothetical protein C4577_05070 [Candidatus Parcubacteria bacterium]|nr:MAG: hypothetical protein C4577_05070 [Candidatus Parcubacteria bacterium]